MKVQITNSRMSVLRGLLFAVTASVIAASTLSFGTGTNLKREARFVVGESTAVGLGVVQTWARVQGAEVTEVGLTLPMSVVQKPPANPGPGPCGAVAVLAFPKVVEETTYFNHFELQWNPHGHPPACCFGVPHFDFHFYGVPVDAVRKVGFLDSGPPAAERLPKGYFYPGAKQCVPQMGVHAVPNGTIAPHHVMKADMVAGFYHGDLTFIEPMVTRAFLLRRKSFDMDVPTPPVLGRNTRYPTRFSAKFDPHENVYRLVWSGFKTWAR